jgi:hypothetical protein
MKTLGRVLAIATATAVVALAWAGIDAQGATKKARACDASLVRTGPRQVSVGALRALRPSQARIRRAGGGARVSRVYRVDAYLAGIRAGPNTIELLLQQPGQPGQQMIASFPGNPCRKSKRTAKTRAAILKARAALVAACGAPSSGGTVGLDGLATLTGAASFDSAPRDGAARNGVQLKPVLRFTASSCTRRVAGAGEAAAQSTPPGPAGPAQPQPQPEPQPEPEPEPPPEPNPPCTDELSGGAIGAEANRSPGRVICLDTAYYTEPGGAAIAIDQAAVRVQAAPGAHPIVCGRFIIRGAGSTVARDVRVDPTCAIDFNEKSPFNLAGSRYPTVPVPPTWLPDFDGTGAEPLVLSSAWEHGKAIFQAARSDPVTATFRIADASQCGNDPLGCVNWQPRDPAHRVADESTPPPDRIPIPAGVRCPGLPTVDGGHDRALSVISADGKTAWEFWHCTHAATPEEPWYEAAVAVKWDLDPASLDALGFQGGGATPIVSNSARASGLPLVSTTITPLEALNGIHHPIGLTVKSVSDTFVPPASHSDGCAGCSHLRYGMMFVLDRSFKLPPDATIGEINVAEALKRYGAYIVDRGPMFELDGSPNEPTDPADSDTIWSDASVSVARLGIKPSDLRYVMLPGSPPAAP